MCMRNGNQRQEEVCQTRVEAPEVAVLQVELVARESDDIIIDMSVGRRDASHGCALSSKETEKPFTCKSPEVLPECPVTTSRCPWCLFIM